MDVSMVKEADAVLCSCLLTHKIHISAHYLWVRKEVSAHETRGDSSGESNVICARKA